MTYSSCLQVYGWGQNNSGQVGPVMNTNLSIPRRVHFVAGTKRTISIACGYTSSMAILENGEVRKFSIYNQG
jgi:RCC1 and BTB domain-containing protein